MKKEILTKVLIVMVFSFAVSSITVTTNVEAKTTETSYSDSHILKKSPIQWVYKSVNGKIYKRAYDIKARKFITDWILCK